MNELEMGNVINANSLANLGGPGNGIASHRPSRLFVDFDLLIFVI